MLAAITVVAATPIDEAVVGTISTAALPVAAVGAFALLIGPEYLRDRAEITPMTPATAVAQQDATMYANAGKGRSGNRAPNAAANWIAGQAGLNREGQRALHDAITGMDYTLDQIREEAARLAEQAKYRIQKPQTEGSDQ